MSEEPRKGGFEKGVFANIYTSLDCGALSAEYTAEPNTLDKCFVLGGDTGSCRNTLC